MQTFLLTEDTAAAVSAAHAAFAALQARLSPLLPAARDIRHIGATAVPGCLTKGDLDIVVRVQLADFAATEATLAKLFERNTGSVRTADFAAFKDDLADPQLGIQLTAIGGAFDNFHCFVKRLQRDPALVEAYNDLKRRFHGRAMDEYREAKGAFVATVLATRP